MTHRRNLIRDAVADLLADATDGPNPWIDVYKSRLHPLAKIKLPGLLIYTVSEQSEIMTMGFPRFLSREMMLAIEYIEQYVDRSDDNLDIAASRIETVLGDDPTFGSTAKDSSLRSTAMTLQAEGDNPYCSMRMEYRVIYGTSEDDPETLR